MFRRANIKLMIYEIEGIPAISRVNPHVPTPCIIPPRPCPPCTRSHHRLNNFPNTVSIYMRSNFLPSPPLSLRSNILCSPMRCNGCANFFRDLFFITIPAVSLHFPFRWTVARISISRHSNSLRFSSRHDCFQSSISLSLFFPQKKSIVVVDESRASFFLRFSRHLVSFFFFLSPFVARQRSLILNCGGYIYIRNQSSSISIVRTRSNVSSRGSGYEFFIRVFGVNTAR